jgi:hypothetical protein
MDSAKMLCIDPIHVPPKVGFLNALSVANVQGIASISGTAMGFGGATWRDDNRIMAAGDAQRVWFAEMIEHLRSQWHQGMSFEAIVELRDDLDAMLQRIRSEGDIRSPVFRCRHCGHTGPGAAPHVSVRALILSLTRFGIAAAEPAWAIEKGWAAHRKRNGLDLYGRRTAPESNEAPLCDHARLR